MRQPTFDRKRRARQQRLLRSGIGVVLVVGIAAILANLLAGSPTDPPESTPQVAFTTKLVSYSDAGRVGRAKPVPARRSTPERDALTLILNGLYQRTFVDPDVFQGSPGDEGVTFPPQDVLGIFNTQARASFVSDLDATTLGSERASFARVEPISTVAKLTIYFRGAREPTLATAEVDFIATGTLREETAFPVSIVQNATLHFARERGRWVIAFYEATQQQDSILPSPTATATEGT